MNRLQYGSAIKRFQLQLGNTKHIAPSHELLSFALPHLSEAMCATFLEKLPIGEGKWVAIAIPEIHDPQHDHVWLDTFFIFSGDEHDLPPNCGVWDARGIGNYLPDTGPVLHIAEARAYRFPDE